MAATTAKSAPGPAKAISPIGGPSSSSGAGSDGGGADPDVAPYAATVSVWGRWAPYRPAGCPADW